MSSEKIMYKCKGTISNKYSGSRTFESKIEIDMTQGCVSENGSPPIIADTNNGTVCRWSFMQELASLNPANPFI